MTLDLSDLKKECSCGRRHSIAVEEIVLEKGAAERLPDFLRRHQKSHPALFCDDNTYEAAGAVVQHSLKNCGLIRFPPKNLHADETAVQAGEEKLDSQTDILVAVGSGTIHDITRFLAHRLGIPFVSVPTAASVDGFVSTVAAMTWNGYKKTFPAVSPAAVFADTDIIADAPYRLTASGVSDLLGKYTALADWDIAHLVTGEYLCERVCRLEREALRKVSANVRKIRAGDRAACAELMDALLLSGIAMQMVGNSRPASGAEHHISHLIEMEVLNPGVKAYHGEKVGVGLTLCCGVYHRAADVLRSGRYEMEPYSGLEMGLLREKVRSPRILEQLIQENAPDPLAKIDQNSLREKIPRIIGILDAIPSQEEIIGLIRQAGGVCSLEDIGLDSALEKPLERISPYVRNRLTFMRLLKLFRMCSGRIAKDLNT